MTSSWIQNRGICSRSQSAWRCAEAEVEWDCLRCELFVSGFLAHKVHGLHAFASLMSGKVLVVLSNVLISYLFWIVLYLHLLPGSSGCLSILDSRLAGVLFCRWVRAPTYASKWYLHDMSMGEGKIEKDKRQTWGCDGYKALFSSWNLGILFSVFPLLNESLFNLWILSAPFFENQFHQQQCGDISPSKKSNIRF